MEAFANSVVRFLEFNEYKILEGKGKVSKAQADQKALNEYKEYNKHQPIDSDFDKQVRQMLGSGKNKKEQDMYILPPFGEKMNTNFFEKEVGPSHQM